MDLGWIQEARVRFIARFIARLGDSSGGELRMIVRALQCDYNSEVFFGDTIGRSSLVHGKVLIPFRGLGSRR